MDKGVCKNNVTDISTLPTEQLGVGDVVLGVDQDGAPRLFTVPSGGGGAIDDVLVNGTSVVIDRVAQINSVDSYAKDETYSQLEVDALLADKADQSAIDMALVDYYDKPEVDTLLASKADNSAIDDVNTRIDQIVSDGTVDVRDVLVNGTSVVDRTTNIAEIDLPDFSTIYTKTEVDTALGQKADNSTVTALGGRVTLVEGRTAVNETNIASAQSDISITQADISALSGEIDNLQSSKVDKGGDTMTGPLILSGDPTADLQAATKQYVDDRSVNTFHTFDPAYFDDVNLNVTLHPNSIDDAVVDTISESKVTGLVADLNSKNGLILAGNGIELIQNADGTTTITAVQDLYEVVDTLPATGEVNKIYLVPNGDGTYAEWLWVNGAWEAAGTNPGGSVDLSNYYNKQNVDTLLSQKANVSDLDAHVSNTNNPHQVTAAQVGLGNVNNTSDANKPISSATQIALDTKATDTAVVHRTGDEAVDGRKTFSAVPRTSAAQGTAATELTRKDYVDGQIATRAAAADLSNEAITREAADVALQDNLDSHTGRTDNPHQVTAAQVGLGNADNTSDANKPISSATQTALNAKANNSEVVKLSGAQTIAGGKTFTINPLSSAAQSTDVSALTRKDYVDAQVALKATDSNVVHTTGAESISGIKTFTSIPVIPTTAPTANGQVASKSYVDTVGNTAVKLTGTQSVGGTKTFTSAPLTSATQSTAAGALTRKDYVDAQDATKQAKLSGIDDIQIVSSLPSTPVNRVLYLIPE